MQSDRATGVARRLSMTGPIPADGLNHLAFRQRTIRNGPASADGRLQESLSGVCPRIGRVCWAGVGKSDLRNACAPFRCRLTIRRNCKARSRELSSRYDLLFRAILGDSRMFGFLPTSPPTPGRSAGRASSSGCLVAGRLVAGRGHPCICRGLGSLEVVFAEEDIERGSLSLRLDCRGRPFRH